LRSPKVAILSALYGCLTKNQTIIFGKNDGGNPPSFFLGLNNLFISSNFSFRK
jgi:hypothetical protein